MWPISGQSAVDLAGKLEWDISQLWTSPVTRASFKYGEDMVQLIEASSGAELAALDPNILNQIADLAGSSDDTIRIFAAQSLGAIAKSNRQAIPALRRALLRAEVPALPAWTGYHEVAIICGALQSTTDWQFDPFFECIGPRSLPVRSINLRLPSGSDDKVKEGLRAFAIADGYEFGHASSSVYKRALTALSRKNMLVTAIPVGDTSMRVSLFATGTARTDQAAIAATFGDIKASMSGIPGAVVEELSYTDPAP